MLAEQIACLLFPC